MMLSGEAARKACSSWICLLYTSSPLGKAVMGRKVGEQAWVDAETGRYCVEIVSIEKGKDDESLPISSF